MHYIMSPELYYSLTNVKGFTNLNGKTYQEQIIVTLGNFLTDELKTSILNTKSDEDALTLLPFDYTHEAIY
jgi:hypothetical protein